VDGLDSTGARPERAGRPGIAALIASGNVAALIASGNVAALIASGNVAALIASGKVDGTRACDDDLHDEMKTAGRVVVCRRQDMH